MRGESNAMDDLLSEFLTETNENIGIVDAALVALEQNPDDGSQIDNIFRLVHTIKAVIVAVNSKLFHSKCLKGLHR